MLRPVSSEPPGNAFKQPTFCWSTNQGHVFDSRPENQRFHYIIMKLTEINFSNHQSAIEARDELRSFVLHHYFSHVITLVHFLYIVYVYGPPHFYIHKS